MKTLIFGCGRARNIYYNPLYQPPPGRAVIPGSTSARAIASGKIKKEKLCHHVGPDVVTVDIDAMKIPHFTANVQDARALVELEEELGRQSFDRIELENFPYTALVQGDGGERFFHCCYFLLKFNGKLTISTGPGVAMDGSHERIAEALRRAGFSVEHGGSHMGYRFKARIVFH
ncbi:MAG: hypothetical protein ABW067_19505 [Rhizobacter sp.]|jgi:hypothetical protein